MKPIATTCHDHLNYVFEFAIIRFKIQESVIDQDSKCYRIVWYRSVEVYLGLYVLQRGFQTFGLSAHVQDENQKEV